MEATRGLAVLGLAVAVSCVAGETGRPAGRPCTDDAGCGGLLCQYGRCRAECAFDRDCGPGLACVEGVDGTRVCTLPDEAGCDGAGDCEGDLVCGPDSLCRQACVDGAEDPCGTGRMCDDGACVDGRWASLSVPEDEDDGEALIGAYRAAGEWDDGRIWIGRWSYAPADTWGYFGFAVAEAIPAGARVRDARLVLWGLGTCQDEGCGADPARCSPWDRGRDLAVAAERSAEPPALPAHGSYDGQPFAEATAAEARWPVGVGWPDGDWVTSVDLATVLQELVDAVGGLPAGSTIRLWAHGVGYDDCAEVVAADSRHPSARPPRLTVGWTEPG